MGVWGDYNYARVSLPRNETDWYPHIAYTDKLWILFYGFGDLYFNQRNIMPFTGNLNLWINTLKDNNWGQPLNIQATIPNPSIGITTDSQNQVIVVGTQIVTLRNTNGFLKKLMIANPS